MAAVTTETVEATESVAAPEPAAAPEESLRPYRMPVDIYEKLVEAGVFDGTSPVFLWEGQLVIPMTKGPGHGYPLSSLHALFFRLLPDGWHVRQEIPVKILQHSEPEPDLSVVRGALTDYKKRTPDASDVAIAVEVSASSLKFDSGEKKAAYAKAKVPVYWIVNVSGKRIDVYTGPSGPTETPGYSGHASYGPGEEVPVVLDGREVGRIAVDDVLP